MLIHPRLYKPLSTRYAGADPTLRTFGLIWRKTAVPKVDLNVDELSSVVYLSIRCHFT
jgi:hypothetical protein